MSSSSSSSSKAPSQTTSSSSSRSTSRTSSQSISSSSSSSSSQASGQTTTSSSSSDVANPESHGPSNLPPVPYDSPISPWKPRQPRQHSKDIEATKLGALMNRMDRIEEAVGKYVDKRGKEALKNSVVPGLDTK